MLQPVEISTRVQDWVLGHFPLAQESKIGPTDSLFDSGIVDSLGILEIVMFLEEDLGLTIEDEDMVADHFETIEAITRFANHKLSA